MVQARKIFKQMVDFNKDSTIALYNNMSIFQNQTENMTNLLLYQATWIPEEGKNIITECSKACKKNLNDSKRKMEIGFDKISDLLDPI